MNIDPASLAPIYIQIADAIEEDILSSKLNEGDHCYSQVTIAKELKVNPATAAKGINLLVARGILIKNRGQAMTIAENAKQTIMKRKKEEVFSNMVKDLVLTANQLNLSEEYIIDSIKNAYTQLSTYKEE